MSCALVPQGDFRLPPLATPASAGLPPALRRWRWLGRPPATSQLFIARPEHIPSHEHFTKSAALAAVHGQHGRLSEGGEEGITHKTSGAAPNPARWPSSQALRACSTSLANKAETGRFHARICQHFKMLLHNCGRVLLRPTSKGLAQLSSFHQWGGLGLRQAPSGQATD